MVCKLSTFNVNQLLCHTIHNFWTSIWYL